MKRIFLLISQKGMDKREHFYSSLSKLNIEIIKKKSYKRFSSSLINEIVKSHAIATEGIDANSLDTLLSFENKQIELLILSINNSTLDKLIEIFHNNNIHKLNKISQNSFGGYIETQTEVIELGGKFFWNEFIGVPKFTTNNSDLFRYTYLPVQLAKDGSGIFFEERIVDRLINLGFLLKSDKIISIQDGGGWEDLNNLTASLSVKYDHEGIVLEETIYAKALVPFPPMRPETLSGLIERRRLILELLNIATTILEASEGLVYERSLPFSVRQYIGNIDNTNIKDVLYSTVKIAVQLDDGYLDNAITNFKIDDQNEISDYYEISSISDIVEDSDMNLLSVLKTDGVEVFWADLSRDLRKYITSDYATNKDLILNFCHKELHSYVEKIYKEIKIKMANAKEKYLI